MLVSGRGASTSNWTSMLGIMSYTYVNTRLEGWASNTDDVLDRCALTENIVATTCVTPSDLLPLSTSPDLRLEFCLQYEFGSEQAQAVESGNATCERSIHCNK